MWAEASVPSPRTVSLDENGTAVTNLETDQIIGIDVDHAQTSTGTPIDEALAALGESAQ